MNSEIFLSILKRKYMAFSRSEKKIADCFINGHTNLHLATLASVADATGVSQMTVSRFLLSLGFKNFKKLKESLDNNNTQDEKALDDLKQRRKMPVFENSETQHSLDLELNAVIEAYQLTGTPLWNHVITMLAERETVYIVGFQATKGMALDFSSALLFLRHGIHFVENVNSLFLEVLGAQPDKCCIVIVDTAAYSKAGIRLAERAREEGLTLIVVTDRYSNWAFEYTNNVFQVTVQNNLYIESKVGIATLLNQLCNGVVLRLGDKAKQRFQQAARNSLYFDTFEPSLTGVLSENDSSTN